MSLLPTILIVGILIIAAASIVALVYAILSAEEGSEDSTGYHRKQQSGSEERSEVAQPCSSTVDTGNPWDQIEGASCPLDLNPHFPHGNFSSHQPSS